MTIKNWLPVVALLVWAGGCGPTPRHPTLSKSDPTLQILVRLPPGRIRQLDPVLFTVRLRDHTNRPVSDAAVTVDLTMPAMAMGENRVLLTPHGQGAYIGTGRFTMAGEWLATVTAVRGGHRSVQSLPVQVK